MEEKNEEHLKKWLLNSILKLEIWKIMEHFLIRKERDLKKACLCILGTSSFHIAFHIYKTVKRREGCVVIVKAKCSFDQKLLVIYRLIWYQF